LSSLAQTTFYYASSDLMFSSTQIGGTLVPYALEVIPYHLRLLFFLLSFLFVFLVFLLLQTNVDDSQSEDFDGGIFKSGYW
jgi:hypothetical protein